MLLLGLLQQRAICFVNFFVEIVSLHQQGSSVVVAERKLVKLPFLLWCFNSLGCPLEITFDSLFEGLRVRGEVD